MLEGHARKSERASPVWQVNKNNICVDSNTNEQELSLWWFQRKWTET